MSELRSAFQCAFRQRSFVVALVVMVIAAATLNSAVAFLQMHFHKKAVALRVHSLKEGIPQKLGRWVMVSKDQAIDPEIEQVLLTREYVFRDYVDSFKVSQAEIDLMQNAGAQERDSKLSELQKSNPAAVIRVGVTYYTGLVDTVAHVPERCYVADGFEVKQYEEQTATLGNYPDGSPRDVTFRFVGFEDQAGLVHVERVARNVGYVFHCNGSYTSSPFEVRGRLQNLLEPYGYYAKIEMMTAAPLPIGLYHNVFDANNHDASIAAMESFLKEALPEIEKCLPDWKALHAKQNTTLRSH
ncbi:MAG TPA: exosortase-associated EpsI family protein [Humisphaera sp.]|nr:exosortase-associated EpsI family protein [Humisphaera sp.]